MMMAGLDVAGCIARATSRAQLKDLVEGLPFDQHDYPDGWDSSDPGPEEVTFVRVLPEWIAYRVEGALMGASAPKSIAALLARRAFAQTVAEIDCLRGSWWTAVLFEGEDTIPAAAAAAGIELRKQLGHHSAVNVVVDGIAVDIDGVIR